MVDTLSITFLSVLDKVQVCSDQTLCQGLHDSWLQWIIFGRFTLHERTERLIFVLKGICQLRVEEGGHVSKFLRLVDLEIDIDVVEFAQLWVEQIISNDVELKLIDVLYKFLNQCNRVFIK